MMHWNPDLGVELLENLDVPNDLLSRVVIKSSLI